MNIYQKLKEIHPDLKCIQFDGEEVSLVFPDTIMVATEFQSGSKTRKLMLLIEDWFQR